MLLMLHFVALVGEGCCGVLHLVLQSVTIGDMKRIMVNFSDEELVKYGLTQDSGSEDVKGKMKDEYGEVIRRLTDISNRLGLNLDGMVDTQVRTVKAEDIKKQVVSQAQEDKWIEEMATQFDDSEPDYGGVIAAISRVNDADFQADGEDLAQVRRLVKEAGLSYNENKKQLWRQEGEKWVLIKEF